MNTIDKNTLKALQEGDHQAFEDIFIAYFDKIKRFISGYIKSEIDAEELAEDIFVNLWINHQSIDPTKSFDAYLHTIARNAALNFIKYKLVRGSSYDIAPDTASNYTSEEEFIAKETLLLIEMAVEKMPEQRRQVYCLSRNEGLKNEEIATRLNTTKRNVESQLSLALKDIRKVITSVFLFFP